MSISAMKCALQSLESVEKVNGWNKDSIVGRHCAQSAHFLRQAIAEAEKQEPLCWVYNMNDLIHDLKTINYGTVYGQPVEGMTPLYTAPPKREWVDLTNDEVNEFAAGCHLGNSVQGAIYKAAARLKEKNT